MPATKSTEPKPAAAAETRPAKARGKLGKILLTLVGIVAVLVAGFAAFVAMQPDELRVERTMAMAAPAEAVFAQVNDFHKWDGWSPWLELDPNAKVTFEGPAAGEGAIFRWVGNANVGEGSMKILESKPNEYVRIELRFMKPYEDTAITEFKLKPEGHATAVTWTMNGQHNFMSKAMCIVMNMDKMIGDNYEKGLTNMKAIVEAPESPGAAPTTEATPSES